MISSGIRAKRRIGPQWDVRAGREGAEQRKMAKREHHSHNPISSAEIE